MIAATIAHLEANKAALGLKLVSGAPSFELAYQNRPLALPAAYVVPAEDVPAENSLSGGRAISQRVRRVIGICIAVSNVADSRGAAASDDLEVLRLAIEGKLYGWLPAVGYDPLELAPARLLGLRDGVLWWQDAYRTAITKRFMP